MLANSKVIESLVQSIVGLCAAAFTLLANSTLLGFFIFGLGIIGVASMNFFIWLTLAVGIGPSRS